MRGRAAWIGCLVLAGCAEGVVPDGGGAGYDREVRGGRLHDLSVIGVDGHDLAGLFDLTTIDQFPHAQGEWAGEAILAALEAPTPAEVGLAAASLPFELVVRGSTVGPPA